MFRGVALKPATTMYFFPEQGYHWFINITITLVEHKATLSTWCAASRIGASPCWSHSTEGIASVSVTENTKGENQA